MAKSWRVEIIEKRSEEMTRTKTSSAEVSSTYGVPEGLWQLKSPRLKRFLEEGRMKGEKESILISVEEQIGEA